MDLLCETRKKIQKKAPISLTTHFVNVPTQTRDTKQLDLTVEQIIQIKS